MRNPWVLVATLALGGCRPVTPATTASPEPRESDQVDEDEDEDEATAARAEFERAKAELKAAIDDARASEGAARKADPEPAVDPSAAKVEAETAD